MQKVEPEYKRPGEVYEIMRYPEEKIILRMKSEPVTVKDVEESKIVEQIQAALKYAWTPGLGLAAIQIGVPIRVAWYGLMVKGKRVE